jgi:hypothetical protein
MVNTQRFKKITISPVSELSTGIQKKHLEATLMRQNLTIVHSNMR